MVGVEIHLLIGGNAVQAAYTIIRHKYGEQNPHQDARHEKPKWNFELLRANLALINVQAVIFGESSVSIEIAGFHRCSSVFFLRSEDTGWHGQ